MTAYRISEEEFLFLSVRIGLSHLPCWCRKDTMQPNTEEIIASLLAKNFLIYSSAETAALHPAIAYMFSVMKSASVWCSFGDRAFMYFHEKRYILLERERAGKLRIVPMENAAACFTWLEENEYFPECQILYDDTTERAAEEAAELKSRMEVYLE